MDWLKTWFLKKILKGFLDKLPFNYKKTIIGVVILLLGIAMHVCGILYPDVCGAGTSVGEILVVVLEWLKTLDAETVLAIGGVVAGIGVTHKALKHSPEAKEDGPVS